MIITRIDEVEQMQIFILFYQWEMLGDNGHNRFHLHWCVATVNLDKNDNRQESST